MFVSNSLITAFRSYVDLHLEQGESLRRWTFGKPTKLAPRKLVDEWALENILRSIVLLVVGLIFGGGSLSSDQEVEHALFALTDRRFLYANVVSNKSGGRTVILPSDERDEFQSLLLSDIRSAAYESGFVKGTLTVQLNDMNEFAFFFHYPKPGQIATEMAEIISGERENG